MNSTWGGGWGAIPYGYGNIMWGGGGVQYHMDMAIDEILKN